MSGRNTTSSNRSYRSNTESRGSEEWWDGVGEGPLPTGWKQFFDDMTGQWYYVHTSTQRSQWHRPPPEGYGSPQGMRSSGNSGGVNFPRLVMTPTGVETRRAAFTIQEVPDSYVVSKAKVEFLQGSLKVKNAHSFSDSHLVTGRGQQMARRGDSGQGQ